jgi:hypothetical protein
MPRRVIECDVGSHRMADECYVAVTELCDERFEIAVERSDDELFGMIAVSVSAEVETHDAKPLGE